jgi:hypothetical protein
MEKPKEKKTKKIIPAKSARIPANPTKLTVKPYKIKEYNAFINMVKRGIPIESYQGLAEELGVSRETIIEWKKMPEYQELKQKLLDELTKGMMIAGADDWKMYDKRRRELGILAPEQKQEPIQNTTNILVLPSELMTKYKIESSENKDEDK